MMIRRLKMDQSGLWDERTGKSSRTGDIHSRAGPENYHLSTVFPHTEEKKGQVLIGEV